MGIVAGKKTSHIGRKALLAVNLAMNGVGRVCCIARKDLGSTPCGSEKYRLEVESVQGAHQCTYERGLARSGITGEEKEVGILAIEHKPSKPSNELALLLVGDVGQLRNGMCGKSVVEHICK